MKDNRFGFESTEFQVLVKQRKFPSRLFKKSGERSELEIKDAIETVAEGEPLEGEKRRSRTVPWETFCGQEIGGGRRVTKGLKGVVWETGVEGRGLWKPRGELQEGWCSPVSDAAGI